MKTLFTTIKYEGIVFFIEYIYTPMIPGKFSGPPEDCYPDEPEEIELISVKLLANGDNLLDVLSLKAIVALEDEICRRHEAGELE